MEKLLQSGFIDLPVIPKVSYVPTPKVTNEGHFGVLVYLVKKVDIGN